MEEDPVVIDALVNKISFLEMRNRMLTGDVEVLTADVKRWRALWEEERTHRVAYRDRMDTVIEKLYVFIGEEEEG